MVARIFYEKSLKICIFGVQICETVFVRFVNLFLQSPLRDFYEVTIFGTATKFATQKTIHTQSTNWSFLNYNFNGFPISSQ